MTEAKHIVEQYLSLVRENRSDDAFDLVADDVIRRVPGLGEYTSKASFRAALSDFLGHFTEAGIRYDIADITAEEDRVALTRVGHATSKTGNTYKNHHAEFYRVADGKIVEVCEYVDLNHIREVLEVDPDRFTEEAGHA